MLSVDASNPLWFGFKGGRPVQIHSLRVGDRFSAGKFPDADYRQNETMTAGERMRECLAAGRSELV